MQAPRPASFERIIKHDASEKKKTKRNIKKLLAAIRKYSESQDFLKGKEIHKEASAVGVLRNQYVASALIKMYGRCRSMPSAREVFDSVQGRDVVTWNSLMLGYVENGECMTALDLFTAMDCKPSSVTFIALLKACAALAAGSEKAQKTVWLQRGIAFYKQATKAGFGSDVAVATTLLDLYCKSGETHQARCLFEVIDSRTVVTWNCMLLGYVDNGDYCKAINLFSCMDIEPDSLTYVAVLKACGGSTSEKELEKQSFLDMGIRIHKQVKARGFVSNLIVATNLVEMYSRCGSVWRARKVFDTMPERDVVAWTSLISGYVENNESLIAFHLFGVMDCEPNYVTYIVMLKACGSLACEDESQKTLCLEKVIYMHEQVRARGFDSDVTVANTLLDAYCKCRSLMHATEVFEKIPLKTVVTWNCFISGLVENGDFSTAMSLFNRMDCEPTSCTYVAVLKACGGLASKQSEKLSVLQKGIKIHELLRVSRDVSNEVVASTLLDMYCKCGSMLHAEQVFEEMAQRGVVAWNCMIQGYVENGKSLKALELFTRMECEPDRFTFMAVLKACGYLTELEAGQKIHAKLCKSGLEQDPALVNSLMGFYAECGRVQRAEELFNGIHSPSIVSWNVLVAGLSSRGDSSAVFRLVESMKEAQVRVDGITFVSILTACSHEGLVEKAREVFDSMPELGVERTVEHFNCIVDVLGRANALDEALVFVSKMPVEANAVTWRTLLGACRKWKNLEVGRVAYEALVRLGERAHAWILMRGIYKSLGMMDQPQESGTELVFEKSKEEIQADILSSFQVASSECDSFAAHV